MLNSRSPPLPPPLPLEPPPPPLPLVMPLSHASQRAQALFWGAEGQARVRGTSSRLARVLGERFECIWGTSFRAHSGRRLSCAERSRYVTRWRRAFSLPLVTRP
eukprot:502075-Pleurochrysis_carterae.AAC.3